MNVVRSVQQAEIGRGARDRMTDGRIAESATIGLGQRGPKARRGRRGAAEQLSPFASGPGEVEVPPVRRIHIRY